MRFLQSKRDSLERRSYFPGPGYYHTSPNNPKFNDFYKASFFQNLTNTESNVDQFGTAPRFNYSSPQKTPAPGPGQYSQIPQAQRKARKPGLRKQGIHDKYKTVPSITQSNKFYEELDDKNFLVKKETEKEKMSDEDRGPGLYDPSFNLVKPKIYHASIPREVPKLNKLPTQETCELFLSSNNLKNRPRSWQKENREEPSSNSDSKDWNTFIQPKPKKMPNKPQHDERGKSLFTSHTYPLTDFYCEPEKVTAFKPISKPKTQQCFESKVNRFVDNREMGPGPGDYNPEDYYKNHHKVAFYRSSMPRFVERPREESEAIGESLEKQTIEIVEKEKVNFCKHPAIFGSGTKRFIESKKIAPGPGDYDLSQTDIKSKKKQTKILFMDIGGSSRGLAEATQLDTEKIDPRLLFEGEEDLKQKKGFNEDLKKFYSKKKTSSFASIVGRFHDKMEKQAQEKNLGPGSYNFKEIGKGNFNTNKDTLFDRSGKQIEFAQKSASQRLGPGSYDYDYTRIKAKRFINVKL